MTFANQRITVMGLGRFGGGAGVARWLAEQDAHVHVTDLQKPEQLCASLEQLRNFIDTGRITMRLGEHHEDDFSKPDLVVANPAVPKPWDNPYLNAAKRSGVPITTEIRLLMERLDRRRVIGVTGTAGKSTTAAMIYHLLTKAGARSHLGGNIGGSLLDQIESPAKPTDSHPWAIAPSDWIVLELSSFMLYWLGEGIGFAKAPGNSPHIAVLTNIEPNHLDWHGSFEQYESCKRNIFRYQQSTDHAIDGRNLPPPAGEIPLMIPCRHNQLNAQLAISAASIALDADAADLAPLLTDFPGLPHRLQLIVERDGIRCYNDSKSTTPAATVLAVQSFRDPAQVHLIAGGYDKGSDLSPIANLASRLAGFYTIGATGRTLAEAASGDHATYCEALDRAVEIALDRARPGEVLLLSPGCASWDQFTNYEERGERFVECVRKRFQAVPSMAPEGEAPRGNDA